MNAYCANLNMQHVTELSTQEIYNGLRYFYILSLLPKNTFFKWNEKKSYKFNVN